MYVLSLKTGVTKQVAVKQSPDPLVGEREVTGRVKRKVCISVQEMCSREIREKCYGLPIRFSRAEPRIAWLCRKKAIQGTIISILSSSKVQILGPSFQRKDNTKSHLREMTLVRYVEQHRKIHRGWRCILLCYYYSTCLYYQLLVRKMQVGKTRNTNKYFAQHWTSFDISPPQIIVVSQDIVNLVTLSQHHAKYS